VQSNALLIPKFSLLFTGVLFLNFSTITINAQTTQAPVRLAVAGITHGHVPWILSRKDKSDVFNVR
jgi:hypothetical protein